MKKLTTKIAIVMLAVVSVSSCKKSADKQLAAEKATSKVSFEHCNASYVSTTGLQHKTTAGGNFVAIGPNPGGGTPYYHGVSGSGFPLTPTPTPGGDNIIRNASTSVPLNNVTGIATDVSKSLCYVLTENTRRAGLWEVWYFKIGDPNNAYYFFTVSGGGSYLSDLEFDFNYSTNPGGVRFLALDRTNTSLIEISMSGTVGLSTNYYTSSTPLPSTEVVTGLAWYNCTPTGPWAHSHPYLLSHDPSSGDGHLWKCTDNTLENGWSAGASEYTFGNYPGNPSAEFGTYFDHTSTQHFVIANDNLENTEAVPAGGPGTPYIVPFSGSTDNIIDMAEL